VKALPAKFECTIFIAVVFSILIHGVISLVDEKIQCKNDVLPAIEGGVEVKYELVEPHSNEDRRFAAFYRSGGKQEEWKKVSILQWAELLSSKNQRSPQLASELTQVIVKASRSYHAFFFETKGCSSINASGKQFEFILVKSNAFKRAEENPDANAFIEYLSCKNTSRKTTACSFWNLGADAKLIAPRRQDGQHPKTYSHLAPFLRGGSEEEIAQIWGLVADEYLNAMKEWGKEPVWLSTSGLGISWLHFRLDQRPKYYTYTEFALEQ